LHFAEVMNSGRTQFRPTPSCDKCDGTGKRTVPTKMIKSAKHAKGLEGLKAKRISYVVRSKAGVVPQKIRSKIIDIIP